MIPLLAKKLATIANRHQSILKASFLPLVLMAVSCATAPKTPETAPLPPAQVKGPQSLTANLFVDKGTKSFKLKTDIFLINSQTVRLDVTTTLDLPLASILLTESKIEYVLYRDKRYYSGKPGPHALDPVFPLAIDVGTLSALLQEKKIPNGNCESGSEGLLRCRGVTGPTSYVVSWSKRETSGPLAGRATKVTLDLPQRDVSLKFYFTDWKKDVGNAERLTSLTVPEGFQIFSTPSP